MDCEVFKETCLPDIVGDTSCQVRLSSDDVLTVPVSSQAGQTIQCLDDGLYAPASDTPGIICEPQLNEPFWVSTRGGGGKMTPFGSPAGIDYCTSHRIDALINFVWYSPDRVGLWAIADIGSSSDVYIWGNRLDTNQPLPNQSGSYGLLNSDSWVNTHSAAGREESPVPNNTFLTPVAPQHLPPDLPDGGWFGWYSSPFRPLTLESALDRINCRALAFLRMRSTGDGGHLLVDQIPWLVEDLQRWGKARAAVPLLTPATYDRASDFSDAGISPGVSLFDNQTVTPADLVDEGVEYVMLDAALQDAERRQEFYDEDALTVMTHVVMSRHYESEEEIDAGADGIISDDAVYSRGYDGAASTTYYETTRMYDGARNKQTGTHTQNGPFADGYVRENIARRSMFIPSPTDVDSQTDRAEMLSGALQIEDPTNYDLTFAARTNNNMRAASDSLRVGIAIGSINDVTARPQFAPDESYIEGINHYRIEAITSSGLNEASLFITKIEAGEDDRITEESEFFDLTAFPTIRCSIQVRPSTITVISYDEDWDVVNTFEFEDPDFRGPYVFMLGRTMSTQDLPTEHSFVNLTVGMPETAFNAAGVQPAADESRVLPPSVWDGVDSDE